MALIKPREDHDSARSRRSNKFYREAKTNFGTVLTGMYAVSHAAAGRQVDQRRLWATVLFTRLCVVSTSLQRLLPEPAKSADESDAWDLSSVAAIVRMILECCLLFHYLGVEEVSEDEAADRINLFHLHDLTARVSMFQNLLQNQEEAKRGEEIRATLLERFEKSALLASKTERQRAHLLRGDKVMFVIQDDVIAKMGVDRTEFRAWYEVLSAHIHSYPFAYHRSLEGGRGIGVENNPEKDWITLALSYVTSFLARTLTQMISLYPDIPDPRLKGFKGFGSK
jgi:hypothetical protein